MRQSNVLTTWPCARPLYTVNEHQPGWVGRWMPVPFRRPSHWVTTDPDRIRCIRGFTCSRQLGTNKAGWGYYHESKSNRLNKINKMNMLLYRKKVHKGQIHVNVVATIKSLSPFADKGPTDPATSGIELEPLCCNSASIE